MPCPLRVVVVAASALLLAFVALAPGVDADELRVECCDGETSSEVRPPHARLKGSAHADAAYAEGSGTWLVGGTEETRERAAAHRLGAGKRPTHLAGAASGSGGNAAQKKRAKSRTDCGGTCVHVALNGSRLSGQLVRADAAVGKGQEGSCKRHERAHIARKRAPRRLKAEGG